MPLDEVTRRNVFLHQHDLRGMVERERTREERGEGVRYDAGSRMATWETSRGELIGRWYGEVIASYVVRDRILRWAWAWRSSVSSMTHAEIVAREGEARGIPQLTMSLVAELDQEEASMLARLGVFVAGGAGLTVKTEEDEISFIGLFDSPRPRDGAALDSARYSVPPPPVAASRSSAPPPRPPSQPPGARGSSPPASPFKSLPPVREIYGPRSARGSRPPSVPPPPKEIREPARSIFVPVATAAFNALARLAPGFQQALFVVTIDAGNLHTADKSKLVVFLVVNDETGQLRALDPPRELVEAAARMVDADRNDGNGPWRKLSARITPKPDGGATLHVDVI